MDSVRISSNCKRMARLELAYTCVQNMVIAVNRTGEMLMLTERFMRYLSEDDKNNMIYRCLPKVTSNRLEIIIQDVITLLELCKYRYEKFDEYIALVRMINAQIIEEDGTTKLKGSKEILPTSLQNPSDSDCTYRKKAGKDYTGYAGHFVETIDKGKEIAIIT